MRIAVLALQGAFIEHEHLLQRLGAEVFEVRQRSDWNQPKDGLVLPGGESTTILKLLRELELLEPIREAIREGLPVFGTCAGLILLAKQQGGQPYEGLSTMDMDVCRNAYGRQLGSFFVEHQFLFEGAGEPVGLSGTPWTEAETETPIPMTFIRAPYVNRTLSADCHVLATVDGHIVAVRQGNQLATAFHPELNEDLRVHRYFLQIVTSRLKA